MGVGDLETWIGNLPLPQPLVLALLVIHDDHDTTFSDRLDGFLDRR